MGTIRMKPSPNAVIFPSGRTRRVRNRIPEQIEDTSKNPIKMKKDEALSESGRSEAWNRAANAPRNVKRKPENARAASPDRNEALRLEVMLRLTL
jgi:hypothetical protein